MLKELKLAGAEYISVPVAEGEHLETTPLLFVSPGEYPIYDLEEYDFMQEDKITEEEYIAALKQCVRGIYRCFETMCERKTRLRYWNRQRYGLGDVLN